MTFDEFIGVRFANDENEAIAYLDTESHHCNPTGNINGGVMLSLADNLATGAANHGYFDKFGEEVFMVGVDLHATMLANQQGGSIKAVSRPVRVGKRVTVVRTQVTGDDDRLLAEVTTTHVPVSR